MDNINKDYYKSLKKSERRYINTTPVLCNNLISALENENIPYSASVSAYKATVTVSEDNYERAKAIYESFRQTSEVRAESIGNTEYKAIKNRNYINTSGETAKEISKLLAGNAEIKFSGIIRSDGSATITADGEKSAAHIRGMIDNIENSELYEALENMGFSRIADGRSGFINIMKESTGETVGFENADALRAAVADPAYSDFFHSENFGAVTREENTENISLSKQLYTLAAKELNEFEKSLDTAEKAKAAADELSVKRDILSYIENNLDTDITDSDVEEAVKRLIESGAPLSAYYDEWKKTEHGSRAEAVRMTAANVYEANNTLSENPSEEKSADINKEDDPDYFEIREREMEEERNRQLNLSRSHDIIKRLPMTENGYEEHFILREDAIDWLYFNPDGADGEGQFVQTTLYEDDLTDAYNARISTEDYRKLGQSAFIDVIQNGRQNIINADEEDFEQLAWDFIHSRENKNVIISAPVISGQGYNDDLERIIERLEDHFDEVRKLKKNESYKNITDEEPQESFNNTENMKKKTLIINAFGGPGAGKTTACLHIASELKKRGFVAEYVSEYAKDLVWDKNFEMLDGSEAHQKMILAEQKKRMDRLIGQVDFVVTDAPILLNSVYLNSDDKSSYDEALVNLFNQYDNFNLEVIRDVNSFEEEGRIQNLEQSQQADIDIRDLLNKNNIYFGTYSHSNIDKVIDNTVVTYKKLADKPFIIPKIPKELSLSPDSEKIQTSLPLSEQLISLTDEIKEKEAEITELVNKKEYEKVSSLALELAELSKKSALLKEKIQAEEITVSDVQDLRSIKPARKSVQNMLDREVAKTPKFEKLLGEEMGEKSAYEMRVSDNAWRNDNSKTVPVVEVIKQNIPANLPDLRRKNTISRGTFVNKDTNIEIIFSKRSIEEIIAKAIQNDKRNIPVDARISAMYQMQDLIENSVCFDSQLSEYDPNNSKNKTANTLFMHQLYGLIKYGNDGYLARLSVEESYITDKEDKFSGTTNRIYNLKDMKITPVEANRIFSPAVGINTNTKDTSTSVTTITIPQLYQFVKTYDQNFFENPSALGRADREAEIKAHDDFSKAMEAYSEIHEQNNETTKFKEKTDKMFKRIDGFSAAEIENLTANYVRGVFEENGTDAQIVAEAVTGSRSRRLENDNSDIDIVIEVKSTMKEDALFNMLNENPFEIGGIKVDINPIRAEETGTLETYLPTVEKYLEKKSNLLDIENDLEIDEYPITFSVVSINGGDDIVVGEYIDDDSVRHMDEYMTAVSESNSDTVDVQVHYYTIGSSDAESVEADEEQVEYISNRLNEVLSQALLLESETYKVEITDREIENSDRSAPNKNLEFTVVTFEDGSEYVLPGKIDDNNIVGTSAYEDMLKNNFDVNNIEDLNESIKVKYSVYHTGDGEAVMPADEEIAEIKNNLDDFIGGNEPFSTIISYWFPWKNVDDILFKLKEFWNEKHNADPLISDDFDANSYLLPESLSPIVQRGDISYYETFSCVKQIKLKDREWLDPVDAVVEMNRRGIDLDDIEMLNVDTVDFRGQYAQKDITPEQFAVYKKRIDNNLRLYDNVLKNYRNALLSSVDTIKEGDVLRIAADRKNSDELPERYGVVESVTDFNVTIGIYDLNDTALCSKHGFIDSGLLNFAKDHDFEYAGNADEMRRADHEQNKELYEALENHDIIRLEEHNREQHENVPVANAHKRNFDNLRIEFNEIETEDLDKGFVLKGDTEKEKDLIITCYGEISAEHMRLSLVHGNYNVVGIEKADRDIAHDRINEKTEVTDNEKTEQEQHTQDTVRHTSDRQDNQNVQEVDKVEASEEESNSEKYHLVVPELGIDVDMRDIDSIEIQTSDDKLMFYYSSNNDDIERAWESNDNSDTAVNIDEVKSDILNAEAEGFKVTVFETAEERKAPENLFNALNYDVNEKFADFIESMDFTVVKVGDKFSLRDEADFGDIHSNLFDSAEDMAGRLDIYINDYYITDIAERLDGIVSGDLSTIDGIIEAINSAADDEKVKEFFNDNITDMQMLDLIANKTDKVDLNIAFADAEIPEELTAIDDDTAITMWEQGLTVYHNGKPLPPLAENKENEYSVFANITADFYAGRDDVKVFKIADDIASEIWDMNRVFSNVPNEVGQPYYLSLEYGRYDEWEDYDSGRNEYQNTINALYTGNFTSVETYLENIHYSDDVSEEMQEQAASLLDAVKVFRNISGVMEKSERETENLSNYFTEVHEGKFKVEEFYKTSPSIGELADFIQNLRENEKQGFGLSAYTADSDGISFLTPRDDGSRTATEYTWEQVAKAISKAIDEGRYITPEDIAERDKKAPKYTIYQVKSGDEYRNARFSSWEELQEPFDRNNYDEIYSGKISDITNFPYKEGILEDIFKKFNNNDRPKDFTGHSLSVSDVVVLDTKEGSSAYFVDSFGMADVTDLFFDLEKQIIDISKLSEIEINDEYDRRGDEPDNPTHIKNTITFSNLNLFDAISRFKEFTYDYDVMPDDDEGYTTVTNRDMIEEINDYIDRSRKDSSISISITDSEGKTARLEGMNYVFAYEPPLFFKPITDFTAVSEEDIRAYHASNNANMECSRAIEEAIGRNYGTKSKYSLDTDTAVKEVLERFSADRVAFVLAARFNELDWDRRISAENISWAKEYLKNIPEQYYENKSFLPHENGFADMFGKTFRKEYLIDRGKSVKNIDDAEVNGSFGFPIDEMHKAFEAENARTDYGVPTESTEEKLENPPENKGPVSMRKVGDFYEMYGKNAEIAADVLGLNLTSKNGGAMVGFPDKVKDEYSKKLDEAGYTVLIEQAYEINPPRRKNVPVEHLEENDKDKPNLDLMSDAADVTDIPSQTAEPKSITMEFKGDSERLDEISDYALSIGAVVIKDNANGTLSVDTYDNHSEELQNLAYMNGIFCEVKDKSATEQIQADENKSEPYEPKLGDKFRDRMGEVWELTSLTGVMPWYTDQCAITKISGMYSVTENESYTNLLDPNKYEHIIEEPERAKTEDKAEVPAKHIYEPKIGDLIDLNDELLSITDISGNVITFAETETLFGNIRRMGLNDFLSSNFSVVEEAEEEIADADITPDVPVEHQDEKEELSVESEDVPVEHLEEPLADNRQNFVITDENFGEATPKARYKANIEAIKTLNIVESEQRTATPDEQQILSGYTGWGAIPQVFDPSNKDWSREYAELKEILTEDEYNAARRSTMNAHYTSPTVINAIYEGLSNLGFEQGKILEPAMGIGNFFGAMPEAMRGSELHGVELDSLTGRIARQLYPTADIQIKGFEETKFENNSFDAVVGNVPFGDYGVNDKDYNRHKFLIHDYFISKSIDKLRPGGVLAVVTSKGTMDKENSEMRKYIAQRAELLGAVRLPNDAFKKNAGTEVTSDILFFQKRERPIEINPDDVEWLKKGTTPDGLSVNNYFVRHPEMVLGKIVEGNKLYGTQQGNTSCEPIPGANLKEQLSEAVKNIKGTYTPRAKTSEKKKESDEIVPAPADSRQFSYYAVDGSIYYRGADETMSKVKLSADSLKRALAMTEIRDNVRELLDLQLNNADKSLDGDIVGCREKLNERYDNFVSKYGHFDDKINVRVFKGDDGYNLLKALENKTDEAYEKADIFYHDTVKPNTVVTHVDSAEEALILSVAEKAKIDFEYMTELCGMDKETLVNELEGQIFRLPQKEEKYVTADEYLTGNIRTKLRELDNAPADMDVSKHREALEAAMPKRVEAKDISVKLGAHWVAPEYVKQFINEKFKPGWRSKLEAYYSKASGKWKIDGLTKGDKDGYTATHVYGTKRKNAYAIIEGILNHENMIIKDDKLDKYGYPVTDKYGNNVKVTNYEETKAVQLMAKKIESEWQDWIFKDPDRREALVEKYNEVFNSIRHREYDGSHLNFVGMNTDITLKEHQKNAVARALYGGNTLLAHAVGGGKTFEMITIAMEGKRLGLHNKSLFAVPNALTEQVGKDFKKLYPAANILVATKKDFEPKNRKEFFAKITTGEWDAVIVGHSQFDRMALSKDRSERYLTEELDKLREELKEAKKENGEKSFSVKEVEKTIARYEKKLKSEQERIAKDDFVDFEQMGFDKLFVDECHLYKNLATVTKMSNVAGIGTTGSAKSAELLMKSKYFDEITGGKGQVYASGTPVSNSMTELYTMMRYLQSDLLKECGIDHFDEWAADFGEVKTDYELKPESDGKYQLKTRFAKFTNLPELMGMFKEAADIRTADTLDLEKPEAHVKEVVAQPSKIQKKLIKSLSKRATKIRGGNVDPTEDNMLVITNDGRKIGLDQRLMLPGCPDDPNSKVNMCVNNVFDIYTKTAEKRSTQVIFCDMSTPKQENRQDRFEIYRPNSDNGFDCVRKKIGLGKENSKSYIGTFDDVKKYVDKNSAEIEDKLQEGDIAVFRVPSEDGTKIESRAAVFKNGKFAEDNSAELLESFAMSPTEDMPPKTFNVYDDIKNKLMDRGIPEKEIAFIHDYDTAEKKQALFNKMNTGEIRVLLGSTAKCGAGMNAQKKMIALHHLDAPLRPSDMEQRNGRIERQGNENKEVDIFRYVTDKSFDAYLYQILENKQKFISQVMTSKTPERVCSDVDEQALDYAEVKALCAGNPLIREEMELQGKIKDLKMEKSRYSEGIYELQDNIRIKIPASIEYLKSRVKEYKMDLNTARSANTVTNDEGKEFYPIKIGDTVYPDRKSGGEALKAAIGSNIGKLAEGKTVVVGEYRGLKLSVLYDTLSKATKACLEGQKHHYCELNTATDTGNIIRLDNLINNMEKDIQQASDRIGVLQSELEQMKKDVEMPFPKADELMQAETRLEEVHTELTKFELTDDSAQKDMFERLADMFPEIMQGDKSHITLKTDSESFMPLSVELNSDILTVEHTYIQNGDLMSDPRIDFKVDYENQKVIPVSFENSGMGVYQTFDINNTTPEIMKQINDVLSFSDDWFDNIEQQGYMPVEEKTEKSLDKSGIGR